MKYYAMIKLKKIIRMNIEGETNCFQYVNRKIKIVSIHVIICMLTMRLEGSQSEQISLLSAIYQQFSLEHRRKN